MSPDWQGPKTTRRVFHAQDTSGAFGVYESAADSIDVIFERLDEAV